MPDEDQPLDFSRKPVFPMKQRDRKIDDHDSSPMSSPPHPSIMSKEAFRWDNQVANNPLPRGVSFTTPSPSPPENTVKTPENNNQATINRMLATMSAMSKFTQSSAGGSSSHLNELEHTPLTPPKNNGTSSPHPTSRSNLSQLTSLLGESALSNTNMLAAFAAMGGAGLLTTAPALSALNPMANESASSSSSSKKGSSTHKPMRPFKAYTPSRDMNPLSFFPGLSPMNGPPSLTPADSMANASLLGRLDPEYLNFREQMMVQKKNNPETRPKKGSLSSSNHLSSSLSASPSNGSTSSGDHESHYHHHDKGHKEASDDSTQMSNGNSSGEGDMGSIAPWMRDGSSSSRKRGRPLPDEAKDDAYWERRRKNNEAAKRSRDARRAKEDEIAMRAAFLEQENVKLRVENTQLRNELSKFMGLCPNGFGTLSISN